MNTFDIVLICLIPLIIWRVYARTRRLVGRQRSTLRRHYIGIAIYSTLLLLLGLHSLAHPESLAALVGGIVAGAALALLGLRLTKFELTRKGYFYTPNAHIGVFLSVAFVCRLIYRFVEIHLQGQAVASGAPADFARSPLTLVVFGMLAGYFVAYAIGALFWRRRLKQAAMERKSAKTDPD
jgi:hypothetical protein